LGERVTIGICMAGEEEREEKEVAELGPEEAGEKFQSLFSSAASSMAANVAPIAKVGILSMSRGA
jgi:hypothetical protein